MQSTGIVPRRPATACVTSRSCLIDGSSGPIPTSCGRSVSAARKSAARSGPRRILPSEGLAEGALARLQQFPQLPDRQALEVLRGTVLLECGVVAVLLVEEERPRVLGIPAGNVGLAA